jgi:hypothetical protein
VDYAICSIGDFRVSKRKSKKWVGLKAANHWLKTTNNSFQLLSNFLDIGGWTASKSWNDKLVLESYYMELDELSTDDILSDSTLDSMDVDGGNLYFNLHEYLAISSEAETCEPEDDNMEVDPIYSSFFSDKSDNCK